MNESTTVEILPAGLRVATGPTETIVDAIRRSGYRTRYSCRRGGCGACVADLVEGRVTYPRPIAQTVLGVDDLDEGKCLPCRAIPDGDVVIRLAPRDVLRDVLGPLAAGRNRPAALTTTKENRS